MAAMQSDQNGRGQMMRIWPGFCCAASLACSALLFACAPGSGHDAGTATGTQTQAALTPWPASLKPFGEAYPVPGSTCRRVGESAATIDFLDDSAMLIGCPDSKAAAALGGRLVATIDGISLVSVPSRGPIPAGTGGGDAKVPGTDYNATAEIKCSGYRKHPAGRCPAGVKRNSDGGLTVIDITWPGGDSRALYFDAAGKLVSANTNQADGSAAFQPRAERRGDTVVVTIGPERYEFADVFVTGD
jgi:hypothetical protein